MKRILYLGLDPTHCTLEGLITHFPVIQIIPVKATDPLLQYALNDFNQYTHIVITSKSTVKILADYLPIFGYSITDWTTKKTIAVGKVTAYHLLKLGIKAEIIAQEETAEGVIKELKELISPNYFYFWPHATEARPIISDFFKESSAKFSECIFYHTHTFVPPIKVNLENFDEIVFTSPSTVRGFLEIFGKLPSNKILTPIGPVTKAFLDKQKSN